MKNKLYKCNARGAELLKTKMNLVLKKNKGFKTLKNV